MSENKNNEVKEIKKNETEQTDVNIQTADYSFDIFESQREREESGYSSEGVLKVFKTRIPIQHHRSVAKNGTVYDNYGVAVQAKVGGKIINQVMMIRPADKRKVLYETLEVIMSIPDKHYLEVTKTSVTNSNTGVTSYIYGMQVSCLTDTGVEFVCQLKPEARCDSVIFENIKRQLIASGEIE